MKKLKLHSILSSALVLFFCLILGSVELMAQDSQFLRRNESAIKTIRTEVRTHFTGIGAMIDRSIFLPSERSQVLTQLFGNRFDLESNEVVNERERILVAKGVRLTHTENIPILVTITSGIPIGDRFYAARGRETRSYWLNDGSLNPGNAMPIRNNFTNDLPTFHQAKLIRDFVDYTQRLDAFLILETEIENYNQEIGLWHKIFGYTVEVVLEY